MATVTSMPSQRPKKLVRYGKSSSRSTYSAQNLNTLLDDDSAMSVAPAPRPTTVRDTYRVEKVEVKKHALKSVKREKKADTFDVPSSEDEAEHEIVLPAKRVSPSRLAPKRSLVNDARKEEELAPWEKQKAAPAAGKSNGNGIAARRHNVGDNKQQETDLASAAVSQDALPTVETVERRPAKLSQSQATTAAARLAARRKVGHENDFHTEPSKLSRGSARVGKRGGAIDDIQSASPRKRARKSPVEDSVPEDIAMSDATSDALCTKPTASPPAELAMFDFPADDDEDLSHRSKAARCSPKLTTKHPRRGKLPSSSRSTPKKGLSAPARLTEMLPEDIHSTDTTSSPSASRPSTPRRSATPAHRPSTPTSRRTSSPLSAAGSLTPRQKELWSQLLPEDDAVSSPSSLKVAELSIGSRRRQPAKAVPLLRTLTKSKSDVPELHRRRTRLVDRLKASAPSSPADEASEEDSDEDMDDAPSLEPAPESLATVVASYSQDQSQTTAVEGGPRITYAQQTRSYLPEDSLDDSLLFDIPSATPQRPPDKIRPLGKPKAASQSSAFDVGESDEEGIGARMRSVHELRAAGRNQRFTLETEALLREVADHSASSRGSRRGALIELATKLLDKDFGVRFTGQGLEHALVAECKAAEDSIADFVLTACFALLLVAETPEHSVASMKHGGVLDWLVTQVQADTDIAKLAKDRKSNMSKVAQSSLLDFAKVLRTNSGLWANSSPATISPRLIGLKALDLMVGKLRRSGDRSGLLSSAQLPLVMPSGMSNSVDTSLAVSVLESVSMTTSPLTWPHEVLSSVAYVLCELDGESEEACHTLFLSYRLALQVTNDNARNCAAFVEQRITLLLLQAVSDGFGKLEHVAESERRAVNLDLLVLAMGVIINLAEQSEAVRRHAISAEAKPIMESLLATFQLAQTRIEEAESVEESTTNVAFGYLAVMLANICIDEGARTFVATRLSGQHLGMLVAAVEEFVMHHQKVDMLSFDGEEGIEVWGAFTERLKLVLTRLKSVAEVP